MRKEQSMGVKGKRQGPRMNVKRACQKGLYNKLVGIPAKPPRRRRNNAPDPFQKHERFEPAENTGGFQMCGHGWRR